MDGLRTRGLQRPVITDGIPSLMILWVDVDMAHEGGGFKVFRHRMVSLEQNCAWNEGLGLAAGPAFRCFRTGTFCRKISQNAHSAYYLDCLPTKHTIFPPKIHAGRVHSSARDAVLRHTFKELAGMRPVARVLRFP